MNAGMLSVFFCVAGQVLKIVEGKYWHCSGLRNKCSTVCLSVPVTGGSLSVIGGWHANIDAESDTMSVFI
uniref:Putative secreted protein n=1 Tax=Anopheles marajoara TaxID=58244 RepID=A0A2M4CEP0_9DIPT